ncbi:MAG: InlB B-repeat-containing protein [Fibrobacter sp.]|nr:InlB B-repeat-containing protein [Fibrobacter sp.]
MLYPMKNIKLFAFLAIFLLSAAVSSAWAVDVTLTYKIDVQGLKPVAHIYNAATGEEVASWDHGLKTLWPANEGHTMNDDYKITFKPNQELDKTDKNENNKSTSTTAFRTEKETFFTVSVGKEGFYLKSVTFKENNTVKASSSNIAPNSTSIRVEVPENKFFNYITVVLTVDAYTVSVPENLTISDAFATISGVNYYKAGETVTFGFSGSGSVVYFVNGERIEGNSVTVGQEDLTVEIGIPYIDENGKEQIRKPGEYTVLTSLTDVSNLGGGWYVVQGKVKYSNQVKFSGDAHLILADSAEMEIVTEGRYEHGINANGNLNIYGQNGQSGILNDTAKGSFCSGINSSNGRITISGGSVTATGTNYPGIYGDKGVSIIGGKVTATGSNSNYGIYSYSGDITIIGGKVTATGSNYGISSYSGNITLGWTNSTDYIYANGYFLRDYEKHVSIAEGKSFKDEKGYVYRGTLTKGQVSDFKGQKLEPFEGVSVSFVDNFSGASDVFAEIAVDGEGHVSAPSKHPFHSGYAFVGWFTSPEGGSEFDFTVKVTENTTAYAHWNENTPVEYIDENGGTNETKNYILLTNDIYVEDDLPGGWYVVEGEVKYASQVKFSGEAHLILADGAKMEIETEGEYGIYASKNLTIYGQNGQSGILNATANGSSGNGIYSRYGDITISGGKVTVTGSSSGIYGSNGVTISGGSVTATGSNYGIYGYDGVTISGGSVTATGENGVGIYSVFGNITISGGKVTATGDDGIYSYDGNITLGWTNSTDFIYASSYYCEKGSVSIAEGKSFKDEKDIVYSGTLTGEQLSAIKGKKLEPCYAVTFDAQNGDDPIMLLTTFDENGVAYVKKPNDPIRSGFTFDGWFTATDGNTEFDFTKAVTENTAAYAKWSIPYIDENGKEQIRKPGEYTVLTSLTDVSNLGGGWYVVQGKVKYSNQVNFGGEAHLILADGAEMEIETESKYGIYASNNLTIYGQSGQGGILNATANGKIGSGIYGKGTVTIIGGTVEASGTNGYGIYGDKGVTISGGTVTATSTNGSGIYGYNGVTISGGSVEAVGKYGIDGSKGVTISGGSVTATANYDGIYNNKGNITLGWTNSTDYIKVSSYYSDEGSVQIAEGKSFKDEKGIVYSGTLTGEQLSAIKGKKLEPCYAVTFDAQNGDDPIMLLTTFDENGVAHVKKPNDPIRSGFTFEGWFAAPEGGSEFDFTKAVTGNTIAYAHWNENTPVEYIDENGGTNETKNYILLTNGIKVDNLPGGWYVVQGEVKYSNQVMFSGEAHLILADGAEMVIKSETYGIQADKNLTIYGQNGQSDQSGTLKVTATGSGIYSKSGDITIIGGTVTDTSTSGNGIYSYNGNITIIGGSVTATGTNGIGGIYSKSGDITIIGGSVTSTGLSYGICSSNGVTISGGSVTSTGLSYGIYSSNGVTISGGRVKATSKSGSGINSSSGKITISGGTVEATGNNNGIYSSNGVTISGGTVEATGDNNGIYCSNGVTISGGTVEASGSIYSYNGNITLGWTNSTDYIKSSYYSYKGSVQIAEGKSFKDENGNVYSGTLSANDLKAIERKTLVPAVPFPDNMVIADIPDQIYTGDSICPMADVTMPAGVDPLVKGEDYKVVCKENLNAGTATLSIQGVGIYYGEIKKTFTIAKAPLTITAKDKTIAYGDEPANDGVEYSGFIGEENASVLGGKLTYSYNYKKLDKVGEYTITPSGLTSGNYEISFVAGALNVEPKATHYAAVQVLEDENGKRAEIDGEYGEGDGIVITEPLEVASVEFSRDFSTQGYSTIVLPFDVNTSKLSGVDSVLSFARIVKEQGEMAVGMKVVWEASASHVDLKANTPYMVKMTGAKLGIDGGVTLLPTEAAVTKSDAQNDGWEFRGTYAYKSWQEGDEDLCRVYGFAGGSNDEVSEGDFVKFTAGASLRPLRAYLINTNRTCGAPKMARAYGDYVLGAKSSIDDLPESMKVVIVGEYGHTTVIGHFNTRTGEFTTGTSVRKFDLKGRAVRGTPSARGAYYGKRVKK